MKEANAELERWIRIALCNDIPLREGRAVNVGNRSKSPSSTWATGSLPWTIAVRIKAGRWPMALFPEPQSSARCTRGR